ncbi:hypothetical protein HDU81_000061 [Chytriomyces hyalinus]|nr:hypothetical protein HDU81_000061 [Chytriomyces hyalinus]
MTSVLPRPFTREFNDDQVYCNSPCGNDTGTARRVHYSFSADDLRTNPVKEAIGFSNIKIRGVEISLNLVLAIFVTLQGFLITLAAMSLLSQLTWLILIRSKAPLTVIDAALRNYPQTVSLLFKQPWNMTSAAVILVFLPVIIDAVQHATVQSLVFQGVADNAGTISYVSPDSSTILPQYEPLLSEKDKVFSGFSPIAAIAAANGIAAVANACNTFTKSCGTKATRRASSLISCESEVDCENELTIYHDYDIECTRNETKAVYTTSVNGWLESSVALTRISSSGNDSVNIVDWTVRRVSPFYNIGKDAMEPVLIGLSHCRIVGAWVYRFESQLYGTESRSISRLYNSAESASAENTTDLDSLSNLNGKYTSHLSSSMGYLELALRKNVGGGCRGQIDSSGEPYNCDNSLYLMSLASDPTRAENNILMLEKEMRFTVEMVMKHLFINVMPMKTSTCFGCSTRNARWASLSAAGPFFGVILGLVMLFSSVSIYLEKRHGCKDTLSSAKKLYTAFGRNCESGIPIISVDKQGRIVVDGDAKEQAFLIADQ